RSRRAREARCFAHRPPLTGHSPQPTAHSSLLGRIMIRKLRTQRDNQQWMLDLALNMRGRVQNFERDDLEVPAGKRARNYRMLPKVWRGGGGAPPGRGRRAPGAGGG